jgi:hypothetical protein
MLLASLSPAIIRWGYVDAQQDGSDRAGQSAFAWLDRTRGSTELAAELSAPRSEVGESTRRSRSEERKATKGSAVAPSGQPGKIPPVQSSERPAWSVT